MRENSRLLGSVVKCTEEEPQRYRLGDRYIDLFYNPKVSI